MSLCRCGNEQISDRLTLTAGTFVVTSGAVEHVTHLPGALHLVSHTDQSFNRIGRKRVRYIEKLGHQTQFRHPVLDSTLTALPRAPGTEVFGRFLSIFRQTWRPYECDAQVFGHWGASRSHSEDQLTFLARFEGLSLGCVINCHYYNSTNLEQAGRATSNSVHIL